MSEEKREISWLHLLGVNGWEWDCQKSIDEEYGYYGAHIYGNGYFVGCWARVSDTHRGLSACGDYGVAWIECDISTYTSADYIGSDDAMQVLCAIDHAESNLLRCGVPFVGDHRFHGENAEEKAKMNREIREKLGLEEAYSDEP